MYIKGLITLSVVCLVLKSTYQCNIELHKWYFFSALVIAECWNITIFLVFTLQLVLSTVLMKCIKTKPTKRLCVRVFVQVNNLTCCICFVLTNLSCLHSWNLIQINWKEETPLKANLLNLGLIVKYKICINEITLDICQWMYLSLK